MTGPREKSRNGPPETAASRKARNSKNPVDRLREPANLLARSGNRVEARNKKIADLKKIH